MRILWSWLTELVEITESPEAVAEKLTRAGLEVEGLTSYRRLPEALDTLRVGRIEKIEKHPAADRLWVCQVAVGEGRPRTLVTGATNIREGDRVPVALPGSQVYGQGRWISLEARTIRGIQSEGMLCSAQEMGLGSDAEGIYLLPPDAPIGAPVSAVLGDYTDQILEISPTPNRGDALSHWGIAREYAALTAAPLRPPAWNLHGERFDFPLRLEVTDPEACPRYGGLYIRGLTPGQTTPDWIRFRLEAAGLRPIHPVVDVTNYILLGWGQPLHAFDGEKLAGRTLRIGPLTASQSMVGLQGQELSLEPGDLVIADQEGPACLAG
ncbi:MAG: phenylalanine--tRNA ligase subunit beta, partial [Bacteroidetes bacterium]